MSDNGSKEHEGPHRPGCHCEDEGFAMAAEGMATVLAELLPSLIKAWEMGAPGMSVDFRFDRGEEHHGIALRAKVLEDIDWPDVPDVDTIAKMASEKPDGLLRWSASDVPPRNGNGKVVH